MSDIMDDKVYIEELRHRISDQKAMLKEQYQKTSNLEQRLAEARALLEEVKPAIMYGDDHRYECLWCSKSALTYDDVPHRPECVWVKIRAFLAQ